MMVKELNYFETDLGKTKKSEKEAVGWFTIKRSAKREKGNVQS